MLFDDEAYRATGRPHPIPAAYSSRARYTCRWCAKRVGYVIVAAPAAGGRPELHVCQYCWHAGRRDWPPPGEGEEGEP